MRSPLLSTFTLHIIDNPTHAVTSIEHFYSTHYRQSYQCGHLYWAVTCIKRSSFSYHVIENFTWIEPFLKGHQSYTATFSLSQRWPLNTDLTVCYDFLPQLGMINIIVLLNECFDINPVLCPSTVVLNRGQLNETQYDCTRT